MSSKHQFDLNRLGSKHSCPGGTRVLLTSLAMKSLKGIAFATLTLKKGGVREPHWHPNASELAYCLQGKALVTMFSPENKKDTFTLEEGEIAYFPRGYLHHIENISQKESKFLIAYDNDDPEDLDLSASMGSMALNVLIATFSGDEALFEKIKKNKKDIFISKRKSIAKKEGSSIANHNKFNLEKIRPQIATKGGCARMARKENFPKLKSLALFSLYMVKNAVREPHWHPNATELNYVIQGKAKVVIFSPNGKIDQMDLSPGQGSVIPAGYFHSIENIGKKELHMAVYFNNASPDDIGISGALSAYSNETLASIFSIDPKLFAKMHHFSQDRMIVPGG